jgi:hypothetical protein
MERCRDAPASGAHAVEEEHTAEEVHAREEVHAGEELHAGKKFTLGNECTLGEEVYAGEEERLAEFAAVGVEVVVVAEAEAQVRASEFPGQGLEGIRTGNAAISGAIEGDVAGGADDA